MLMFKITENTQKMVEFLKNKPFAGGIRPVVCVETLSIDGCLLDVIIIKNSRNTPFYLIESFDKIKANSIYTRVMDTNTPFNKTADINHVEELWKKRFHLDEKPKELVCYYLDDAENWESSPAGENTVYYYSHSPEYTIREEENDGNLETYYMFVGADHNPYWFNVSVYYHQTALAEFPANGLDGGRCCVIAPEHCSIRFGHPGGNPDITYEYYIRGSFRHKLLEFFRSNGIRTHGYIEYCYTFDRFMDLMLVFSSKNEKDAFNEYVKGKKDLYERLFTEVEEQSLPFDLKTGSDYKKQMKTQYLNALVLKQMLKKFCNED